MKKKPWIIRLYFTVLGLIFGIVVTTIMPILIFFSIAVCDLEFGVRIMDSYRNLWISVWQDLLDLLP